MKTAASNHPTVADSPWSKLSLSAHPEMAEELEDDRPEVLQTLTFDDLLSFAFQVAKGMEFLSSKNVSQTLDQGCSLPGVKVSVGRRPDSASIETWQLETSW